MKMDDRELLQMFKKIDNDGSGTIEEPELQKFLEELHIGGAKTAKSMMDLVDANGDRIPSHLLMHTYSLHLL